MKFRDQGDVLDAVHPQGVAQSGGGRVIAPGDSYADEPMGGLGGAVARAHDCRHHLAGQRRRIGAGGYGDGVVVNCDAICLFALHQHHADRRGCHGHPEHDLHCSLSSDEPPTTRFIAPRSAGVTR